MKTGQASHALTDDPDGFDPARWLTDFERLGGGWVLRDHLALVIRVEYQTDEDLSHARQMIVDLTDDQRLAIFAHLRSREG